MTREDFKMWIEAYDCYPEPFEAANSTGHGVYYVSKKDKSRFIIMVTPMDDRHLPDRDIRTFCDRLLIPYPDCVAIKTEN